MSQEKPLSQRSLTRLEAIMFVMVIGLLVIVYLPKLLGSEAKTKKRSHMIERRNLNTKLTLYYELTKKRPISISELAWENNTPSLNASALFPDSPPATCIFGARWQIDPKTRTISLEGHRFHE
ncbi:MAG: hypothetical protein O3A01_01415 [bacterium]|nr:hypothetical protein [bacterium]